MKNSIRKQLTIFMLVLVSGTLLSCIILNNLFLEKYYRFVLQKRVTQIYEMINNASVNGDLEDPKTWIVFKDYANKNNLQILILEPNQQALLIADINAKDALTDKLMRYVQGEAIQCSENSKNKELIVAPNEIFTYKSKIDNREYMEIYGELPGERLFIVSCTMESVHLSVILANRFISYVGVLSLIFGSIFSLHFARRFARPIMELAKVSERMSKLDFSAKYKGHNINEIGFLGNNINELSGSLERTISELKTANNVLSNDLARREKLEEMRSDFVSNVSHELKTPIALIQGYAEGLTEGVTQDPESMQFYLDVIKDEAGKMNSLVKNLISLNQLEFGMEEVSFERFDIIELIHNYIESSQILYRPLGIKIIPPSQQSCFVWGDEYKIEQVLTNYFTNAVHHCKNEKNIEIQVTVDDNLVKVSVFNTGDIIPDDCLPHLWEKFYKADKSRSREYGGSGIGLSIVKAIMVSMNQKYGVENKEKGPCFWFTLDYAGTEEI